MIANGRLTGRATVELSIPVEADLVVLARLTAATVASRAGFDIEEIEDLRLAVEELCLSLVEPDDDGRLHLAFDYEPDAISVQCRFHSAVNGRPARVEERDDLSLRILDALVDDHGRETDGGERRAWLRKRRPASPAAMTDEVRPSREDMRALFVELAETRDPRVRDRLATAYLGLAHQLTRRYVNRGEPYDDLVQVASMAIVKSVNRFDPDRGVEFTTFATRTVIGELKRHFRDKGWAVRAPRRVQELYLELGKVTEMLSQELGRSPTVTELAKVTGATEEAVLEALEAGQGYRTSSIDATDRNEETLASHIGAEDASLGIVEEREILAPALARLAPRERLILQLRFGQGLTQSEIATRIGISQMHVSRLLSASLERLRKSVAEPEEAPDRG